MGKSLIVFDLDHTLFSANSSFRFGAYLYQQGVLSFWSMLYLVLCYFRHKINMMTISDLHLKCGRKLFTQLTDLDKHVESFLHRDFASLVYSPVEEKLNEAKEGGDFTVLLSSSPDFLVGPIAKKFGVDDWGATQYSIDSEGRLISIPKVMLGEEKACFVSELALRLGIDKENIIAYTDSIHDLPLLKVAGVPIGVNVDRALRSVCKQNQWEIF